ncbi:conserved hypothetical protein (plasmid) [Rhodococcus jostii RHA1]|uniref:Uncharacterized protein n=1 Tax=Rhodococcus jostii (strain RHA1) TaxID=101510 RepID=Q0RXK5_RHOJR|nr:conserved hypothetical protein [Rhodococcus jostii RHA1]
MRNSRTGQTQQRYRGNGTLAGIGAIDKELRNTLLFAGVGIQIPQNMKEFPRLVSIPVWSHRQCIDLPIEAPGVSDRHQREPRQPPSRTRFLRRSAAPKPQRRGASPTQCSQLKHAAGE